METKVKNGASPALEKIQRGMYFSAATGGIYETSKKEIEPDAISTTANTTVKPWAKWGKDNNYPQRLIDAVKADPVAALLERKIAFHYGRGLMFFSRETDDAGREKIRIIPEEKLPQEIRDFMRANQWKKFMQGIIADFEWWHQFAVQYITDGTGKIVSVKWQRIKNVRPEKRDLNTGLTGQYYLSGYWPEPKPGEYAVVPAFNPELNASGLCIHSQLSIDKDYFTDPAWHAITRWLYIASKIPRWILANIDNSMNLKYHIKIPWKYFLDKRPRDRYPTDADHEKAVNDLIEETFQKMDQYLTGETNVHKAFYSFITTLEDGKPAPGWEINVVENKLQDEAWLRAYGTAALAMISGIGLSPSIAGYVLPNGLGSGSGSDLREQFNYYIQVMTTIPREITLEPWELIKQRNGWPAEIHLGYRDIVLQSLDQNKSGFAQQNEQAPTTNSQSDQKPKDPMSV